ncbi:hypothetical protein [Mongoliimonas terrestris]|uniref:hypothetical protein n=1 Tax=Mongoliimonas terrestris TaxID=1709001 RepID=UPI000949685B|nr:hypothetical protein [Mongoliimonas terrestris]
MTLADGYALLRPFWLLAVPALVLLGALVAARGALGDWRRAIDGPLLSALMRRGAVEAPPEDRRRLPAALAAAGLLALALAGPAVERAGADTFRNLDAVLIGLDVSRSAGPTGEPVEGRVAALQVAEAAGTRQAGLMLYGGDAYLAAPFTADRTALAELLAAVRGDMVPEAGSAPERAIRLAIERFDAAAITHGTLVLVTDGGGVDEAALQAGRDLAAAGHRLDVVYVTPVDRPANAPAPDAGAAGRLADAGGGDVADGRDAGAIGRLMATASADRVGRSAFAVLAYTDIGRYLAGLALLPMLLLFRRRR